MILRELAGRIAEARDITSWGPYGTNPADIPPPTAYGGGPTLAGLPVSEARALRLSAVYACQQVITDDISTLPLHRFRRNGDRRERLELPELFAAPVHDSIEDLVDWVARLVSSLVLRGNAYARVLEVDNVGATQVNPLHPDDVHPFRDRGNGRLYYSVSDPISGRTETLEPFGRHGGDIWHVRGITLAGHDEGLSPIGAAEMAVTLGLAAESFGAQLFLDGALPSAVISTPEKFADNAPGRARARQVVRDFERVHRGRRRTALLSGGAEWKPVQLNPDEAQFIETRKLQLEDVARIFRVKPHKIGILDRATFSNIESQSLEHVGDTLRPWVTRLEVALGRLFPYAPPSEFYKLELDGLLRGDFKTRMEGHALARQWGIASVNDILTIEDRDPIGAQGDIYLTPLTHRDAAEVPIGERAKAAELLTRAGYDAATVASLLGLTGLDVTPRPPATSPAIPPQITDALDHLDTGGAPPA